MGTKYPKISAKDKKPFYKRWWFILIVIIVVLGIIGSIGENKKDDIDRTTKYTWPDSALATMIPQPTSEYGKVSIDREDSFWIDVYEIYQEDFEAYIKECKDSGFTVDYSRYDSAYYADNEEGYSLSLNYYDEENMMKISLSTPSDENETNFEASGEGSTAAGNSTEVEEDTDQSVGTEESQEQSAEAEESAGKAENNDELVDGMRPGFKEAMDSYEAFFDEYCDFMKKYSESSNVTAMLGDYTDFMTRYADVMQKLGEIEEGELNSAELKYYTEVMGRINQKLIEVVAQ